MTRADAMTDDELKRLEEEAREALRTTGETYGAHMCRALGEGVLALIERVRLAEAPPVTLAGDDAFAVRLGMAGGLVAYAATRRPDGGTQGLRFEPPVEGDVAERVLSSLFPIPDAATVFVLGSPPESGLDGVPLRYDYLPAAARLKVRTQHGRRTPGIRHVIDWADYRVTREGGSP